MYILNASMYILGVNMYILGAFGYKNVPFERVQPPVTAFVPFFWESWVQ